MASFWYHESSLGVGRVGGSAYMGGNVAALHFNRTLLPQKVLINTDSVDPGAEKCTNFLWCFPNNNLFQYI